MPWEECASQQSAVSHGLLGEDGSSDLTITAEKPSCRWHKAIAWTLSSINQAHMRMFISFSSLYSLLQIYPQSLKVVFSSHKSPIEIKFIFWLVNVSLVNQMRKIFPVYENQARVGISRPLTGWLHPQTSGGSPPWSWGTWPSLHPCGHK